jgi:hypothetical protein
MMSLGMIRYTNAIANGGGFCAWCEELTDLYAHRFEAPELDEDEIEDEPAGLCKQCVDDGALEQF